MSHKYLKVCNNEYINTAHIVKITLTRSDDEPEKIKEINFELLGGKNSKTEGANFEMVKRELELPDIVL